MIGNAFPPLVAKAVGEQIREVLENETGVVVLREKQIS